jgi:hypothetical protein
MRSSWTLFIPEDENKVKSQRKRREMWKVADRVERGSLYYITLPLSRDCRNAGASRAATRQKSPGSFRNYQR